MWSDRVCHINNGECSQKCRSLGPDRGASCYCLRGYSLGKDRKTCEGSHRDMLLVVMVKWCDFQAYILCLNYEQISIIARKEATSVITSASTLMVPTSVSVVVDTDWAAME